MARENKHRILIVDDDRAVCASLSLLLSKNGFEVDKVHYPAQVLDKLTEFRPHIVVLDMNFTIETTGKQGLHLLKKIRYDFPDISVVLMTGWATVQLAVEGMKLGAKDFIAKPWDNKDMLNSIKSIIHIYQPEAIADKSLNDQEMMIGEDPKFKEVLEMAERVAPTEASVLILGESGTGKELLAEYIHQKSKRSENVFVKVNLGGISSSLFESEMFGHKKGAFTGAYLDREGRFTKANKGTIFLDEIGELQLESQVKLLRVLQEKTYEVLGSSKPVRSDFRVISATNKDLEEMVYKQTFREDLFYRINLITLFLPSLAERQSDIPGLVKHFTKQLCTLYDKQIPYIDDAAFKWLSEQKYPGNIRSLKNQVERTILLNFEKKDLSAKDFKEVYTKRNSNQAIKIPAVGTIKLDEMEEHMIRQALSFHQHNISKSARSLGISRSALYRRLEKYNIPYEPQI